MSDSNLPEISEVISMQLSVLGMADVAEASIVFNVPDGVPPEFALEAMNAKFALAWQNSMLEFLPKFMKYLEEKYEG